MSDSDSELSDLEHDAQVWQDGLLQYLKGVKSAGAFAATSRHTAFPNPGIQIEGGRILSVPLTPSDAEAIKSLGSQATYGKGDRNIVDTSMRKTWELRHTQFRLANPEWESYFGSHIVKRAADGLGLAMPEVTAHLHKLLLYEKGSFFKSHKDSDDEPGVVGTLVVCLPSRHEGGEVHLSFRSEERTMTTAPDSAWDITALAWFCDVTHEVAEFTDGYRLVLTYKLAQTGVRKQSAQFFHQQLEGLRDILLGWDDRDPNTRLLYYPLDHLYTENSLLLRKMKGRDRAVCQLLHDACSDSDVFLFLAHIMHRKWEQKDLYYDPAQDTTLTRVFTCDGTKIGSRIAVDEDSILGEDLFDGDPDSETEGGYVNGRDHVDGNSRYHYTVCIPG